MGPYTENNIMLYGKETLPEKDGNGDPKKLGYEEFAVCIKKKNKVLRLLISALLAVLMCNGCRSLDAQTALQGGEYVEDNFENGLMWMFEKGLPMYFSNVSLEELESTQNIDEKLLSQLIGNMSSLLARETKVSLTGPGRLYLLYWNYLTLLGQAVNDYYGRLDVRYLAFRLEADGFSKIFGEEGNVHYQVRCYLRDIQDTVIEYWVVVGYKPDWEVVRFYFYDKQLFFITVADSITAPRRVAIRSDQFVETAEVGGRIIQFPKDNLYILYSLDAKGFPMSYLNSDMAGYKVVMKGDGTQKKPYDPYLKKIGRVGRFFYSLYRYNRAYIGKHRIKRV
jgi:hypothetical protein